MQDKELMAEISALGDQAERDAPEQLDLSAAATKLGQRFEHRSVEEIHKQLQQHFRQRGLFWQG